MTTRARIAPPRQRVNIERALTDAQLLGAALGDNAPWATWLTVLKAAFALDLSEQQRRTFVEVAGNRALPGKPVRELWCAVGRRGGKSRMAAAVADYLALFVPHKLARGETGMVLVLAASQAQAKVTFDFCLGFLEASALLRGQIARVTRHEIRLRNGIVIAVHSNSFRSIRGRTLCACVLDEVAFWQNADSGSAMPDTETYTAVLPALLTTKGMLVGISSPYRRQGLLYAKHKANFGQDSPDILVGRPLELSPQPQLRYQCFIDASGGAIGGDAYCLAIGHREKDRMIVDLVRGKRGPFDPQALTQDYANLAREYGVRKVIGDHYGAQWVEAAWRNADIGYQSSDIPASQIYLESLPAFTRSLAALPNHPTLIRELLLLERSPGRLGKDQVTHPRGAHDDYANAVCGLLHLLSVKRVMQFSEEVRAWARVPSLTRSLDGPRYIPAPHRTSRPPASSNRPQAGFQTADSYQNFLQMLREESEAHRR